MTRKCIKIGNGLFEQHSWKTKPNIVCIYILYLVTYLSFDGQLNFDDRETVFRCPVLLLHGCQPIDLNACFSLNCISYVELCQREQINSLLLLLLFILLSRESDQCAIRARLGVAGHLSITPRWGNLAKCLSQRHNK